MRIPLISAMLLAGLAAGCAGQSATKPVEMLDERTGVTVGALKEPIELAPSAQSAALASHKQSSFAYLGPIEWNRSGNLSYGLWIHIVPGSDRQPGDLHAPDAIALTLDDGPLDLPLAATPRLARAPYPEIASLGPNGVFRSHGCRAQAHGREPQARPSRSGGGRFLDGLFAHAGFTPCAHPVHAGSRHYWRLTATTRGNVIAVPGRTSLKSTSGLYSATSQIGISACCCAITQSDSPCLTA
jgi:hypothetical protein